jgi:hypothetical protein
LSQKILLETVKDILEHIPYKPFICLPMSALLYAMLKDNHNIPSKLVNGDFPFKDQFIFKQDFSITKAKDNAYQEWRGTCLGCSG